MAVKVGIPEFLNGIGKGVEAHVEKLESEFGDLQKLLVARTLKLKKLEIPCKHVSFFFSLDTLVAERLICYCYPCIIFILPYYVLVLCLDLLRSYVAMAAYKYGSELV